MSSVYKFKKERKMADCGVCIYCWDKYGGPGGMKKCERGIVSQSISLGVLMNLKKKLIQVILFRETIIGYKFCLTELEVSSCRHP